MPIAGGPRCLVFFWGWVWGAMTRGDAKKHTHTKWNILIYCNMYFFFGDSMVIFEAVLFDSGALFGWYFLIMTPVEKENYS